MTHKKKITIAVLLGAYVFLGGAMTVARMANRPAEDTTSTAYIVASAIIYLACSLGIAWLLELLLTRFGPANHITRQLHVELIHQRRREKGVICGKKHYSKIRKHQLEAEHQSKRLTAAYHLGYFRGQANQRQA